MLKRGQLVTVALLSFLSGSCGDQEGPNDCTGDVALSATDETPPTFTWEPACQLTTLAVSDAAETIIWLVTTPGVDGIAPPVLYGVVPPGAEERQGPGPVRVGFSYTVQVWQMDRDGGRNFERFAGEDGFRP